jgi:hypothetical protein
VFKIPLEKSRPGTAAALAERGGDLNFLERALSDQGGQAVDWLPAVMQNHAAAHREYI